ncbi:hypothetical protein [Halobacteriovorax marinus]|uniref:hypothetical protein n=1 Tax=Halobacteriovorax marinus TaxID=97084 RepID=UPI003A94D89B
MSFFRLLTFFLISTISLANSAQETIQQPPRELDHFKEHLKYRHSNSTIKTLKQSFTLHGGETKEVSYEHDEYGFRKISSNDILKRKASIIFAGGSFTYGHGLNLEEIFSFKISEKFKDHQVLNFGLPGTSITEQIFLWEHFNFQKKVKSKRPILILTIFNDHLNRESLSSSYLRWAPAHRPVYTFKSGQWKLSHPLSEEDKYQRVQFFKKYRLDFIHDKLSSVFEIYNRRKEIENFASKINYLKSLFLEQFPEGKFFVTEMAPFMALNRDEDRSYLIDKLKYYKIVFWHNGTIEDSEKNKEHYQIPGDGHPNALLNEVYTDFLADKIKSLNLSSF